MIIDTSAIIAILTNEPERRIFNEAIESDGYRALSAANFVAASIVLEARYGYEGVRDLDLFMARAEIVVVPVDLDQTYIAREAFRQYGKGRQLGGLNYGDCFSYALATATGQLLLFKGSDFSETDLELLPFVR